MTEFEQFIADEVKNVKGIYFPVKSSFFERAFVHNVSLTRLHPNPNDEFCIPEIGPSYRIINEYVQKYSAIRHESIDDLATKALTVEKIYPDGYLILNGHHRWAAYIKMGRKTAPVQVVNLTHEADIEKMIKNASHDKRITLDLDEVVFGNGADYDLEKGLPFPFGRIYKERLRRGIPALFHFFIRNGYDIWVYSSRLYSMDYIRHLFKLYHVNITGIVTGTGRKGQAAGEGSQAREKLESMIAGRYKCTLHIDNDSMLRTGASKGSFDEYPLSHENWGEDIMKIIGEFD